MSVLKRAVMIIAVIAIFMLAIAGTISLGPISAGKPLEEAAMGREKQVLPGMEINTVFFAQDFDYIAMYGDPAYWDDEVNLSIDINADEQNDINFTIASSIHEGIDLKGSVKQSDGSWKSMNFWSADLYDLFSKFLRGNTHMRTVKAKDFLTLETSGLLSLLQEGKYIVKGCRITEDDYVQISVCDIDEDGSDEVLVSVGNQLDENVTAIYEFSDAGKAPFTYCGYIYCDTVVEYKGGKILWAYRGNLKDRLHDTYIYDGSRIKKIGLNSE